MKKILLIFTAVVFIGCKDEKKETSEITLEENYSRAPQQKDPAVKESISRGAEVYNNFCASCHLASGEGIQGTFPPLAKSDWLTDKRKETIHAVKYGLSGPIKVNGEDYDNLMPALGLTDEEVADVLNYISHSWGNNVEEPFTKEEVASIEK